MPIVRMGKTALHYEVGDLGEQGWARVTLTDEGLFMAVSDYGTYGYVWSGLGKRTLREFLRDADESYLTSKLLPPRDSEYNAERTGQNMRRYLLKRRREEVFSESQARRAWDDIQDYLYPSEQVFRWFAEYGEGEEEAYEAFVYVNPHQASTEMFVKKILKGALKF